MADEESLYLDNLDEFINDQDKVVTYKWLSRTLSVASNTAKQMLYAFLLKEREKKSNSLTATYLVGGRFKVDDQLVHQYVLTSDDKLEETKKQFECVTSVHVYSLQKKTPKDINTLYTVDYEAHQEHKDEPNKWSHIYCKEAIKLSDGGASRGTTKGKPGKENAVPKPEITNGLGSSSSMTDKSKPKSSNQRPKKGQLPNMGMFAVKAEKKPEPKPDEPVSNTDLNKKEKTAKPAKPAEKSKSSGMMSFFGKQISEPAKSKPEPKEKPKEKVEEKVKEKSEDKKPVDTNDIKETPENKQKSSKPTKQTRKRIKNLSSSDEEEDPVPKSLKKLVSDSESEEEIKPKRSKSKNKKEKEKEVENKKTTKKETKKGKEATQDEAKDKKTKTNRKRKKEEKEESTEEESINSKSDSTVISETPNPSQRPAENSTKRRKRRKVMKSKTYVDDDGFMVTEKVYESESTDASDEEEVIEAKQDPLPSPLTTKGTSPDSKPKKQMDLKPVKQASLMSFFKKN